jgi:hypothetical protein
VVLATQIYLLEVGCEAYQHLGFDFMYVPGIGGIGATTSGQVQQPMGPVPPAQHAAL